MSLGMIMWSQKYGKKAKLCYIGMDIFIVYIKTDDICQDIAEDVEARSHTSNSELDRPLRKRKKWKNNWINERWIKWANHDTICWIKNPNL